MVNLKGKIIEVYPGEHQMVVRYYSDEFPPEPVDDVVREDGLPARCRYDRAITVWQTPMPEGAALAKIIADAGQAVRDDMEARLGGAVKVSERDRLKAAIADPDIDTAMTPAVAAMEAGTEFVLPAPNLPDESVASTDVIWRKRNADEEGIGITAL